MKKETYQEKLYHLPYHWMVKGYFRVSMEFRNGIVINRLKYSPGQRILDLGCGDGYFMAYLKNRFRDANIIGADYNLRALRFARIMTDDVPCVATSAVSLGLKEDCFDAVLLLDVIEHLSGDDRDKVIDQVSVTLKPGGVVIITVPSKKLPMNPSHYDHFCIRDLEMLMKRKFAEIKITGCCLHLPIIHELTRFPIIWRIIYFIIRECNPQNAATLIAYGKKNN
jgi:2-polyprenyl-3-methyl-5-hydroxy-6-metoxy-1,4-benzoquinol methylase